MSKQPQFTWDETSGICGCSIILDDILHGFGIAQCAPEDNDIMSEQVGMHIAELRAQINLLQNFKNYELRPGLKALKHLRSTMMNSKQHDSESYERKRLNIEIRNTEKDIMDINNAINQVKQNLYDYINLQERIAQHIRSNEPGYKDEDSEMLLKDINIYEKVIKDA